MYFVLLRAVTTQTSTGSTSINKADTDPHKDPPWAEETDNKMEEVVSGLVFLVDHPLCHLWLRGPPCVEAKELGRHMMKTAKLTD